MTIYEALKKDHKKVHTLLDQLVAFSESENSDRWKRVIDEIRDELIPHARAEEALLYNPLRDSEQGKSEAWHGYREHAMAETELRALQAMKAIDVNWTTLAKKLRQDILHHVQEEEGKIFAAAQRLFSDEEARQIGRAFEELKPVIRKESFTGTTLELIANLLPSRMVPGFRSGFDQKKKSA